MMLIKIILSLVLNSFLLSSKPREFGRAGLGVGIRDWSTSYINDAWATSLQPFFANVGGSNTWKRPMRSWDTPVIQLLWCSVTMIVTIGFIEIIRNRPSCPTVITRGHTELLQCLGHVARAWLGIPHALQTRSQPATWTYSRHWSRTSRQSRGAAEYRQVRGTVKVVPVHSDSHRDTWPCRWRGDTFLTGTRSSYSSSDQRLAIYVISLAAFECGSAKRKCGVCVRHRTLGGGGHFGPLKD